MAQKSVISWIWGRYSVLGIIFGFLSFAVDQAHKYWMLYDFWPSKNCNAFTPGLSIEPCIYKVTSFMNYVMVWNAGISYGLFPQDGALGRSILIAIACFAVIILIFWLARVKNAITAIAIGLIIGGALGNALDRYLYGAVADFFSFHLNGFYWYVFNIADVAIVAGVIGLLYDSLFESRKKVSNVT